jgi:hypothetical protein
MSEDTPPKEMLPESAADPNQLSEEDLKKAAGGRAPYVVSRLADGSSAVSFEDGQPGKRPPDAIPVSGAYR